MWLPKYLADVADIAKATAQAATPLTEDAAYAANPAAYIDALPFDKTPLLIGWKQMGRDVGDMRYYECKQELRAHLRSYLAYESEGKEEDKKSIEKDVRDAFLTLLKIDPEFNRARLLCAKEQRILALLENNATPPTTFYSSFGLGKIILAACEKAGLMTENKGYERVRIKNHACPK